MIIENSPTIETERLILRKITTDDLQDYFLIMNDEEANTFLPWFKVDSLEEAEKMLQMNFIDIYQLSQGYRYVICLKEDNKAIGYCGLSNTASNDIGYGLRREFWHKGIVTEAITAMVKRIKDAGYKFITATHDVNNARSGKVMEKIGMTYKYTYVERWQPKNVEVAFRMYQLNFDGNNDVFMEYWDKYDIHYIEHFE